MFPVAPKRIGNCGGLLISHLDCFYKLCEVIYYREYIDVSSPNPGVGARDINAQTFPGFTKR